MAMSCKAAAQELLEVVPAVMCFIRGRMRSFGAAELSVPQFRTLLYVRCHAGTPLCCVARHLGQAAPSTSRLVDGLEGRGLLARESSSDDRRRLGLRLTREGGKILDQAMAGTRESLAKALGALSPEERRALSIALPALARAFSVAVPSPGRDGASIAEKEEL